MVMSVPIDGTTDPKHCAQSAATLLEVTRHMRTAVPHTLTISMPFFSPSTS